MITPKHDNLTTSVDVIPMSIKIITWCATSSTPTGQLRYRHIMKRNYRLLDDDSLNNNILSTCASLSAMASTSSAAELVNSYNGSTRTCIDKHAPERRTVMRGDKPSPWYNGDIDDARRQRRKNESLWRRTQLEYHRQMYVAARDECNKLSALSRTNYYSDKLQLITKTCSAS